METAKLGAKWRCAQLPLYTARVASCGGSPLHQPHAGASLPPMPPCRSLYHDCVRASCGHRFCGGCIRGARDCPACGADIESLQPDAETQGGWQSWLGHMLLRHIASCRCRLWPLDQLRLQPAQVRPAACRHSAAAALLSRSL